MLQALINRYGIWLFPLAAIACYWPGLWGDFVFDDIPNIVENRRIQLDAFSLQALWEAAWSWRGDFSRPLAYLSFAINYYFSGLEPFWFKWTNLAIHIANFLLIRIFLKRLLISMHVREGALIALLVASLWLVHPINLSSVIYVVQRMTSLSALFTLLALIGYLCWRSALATNQNHKWWLLGVMASTACAFLSKENGILVPFYIAAIELVLRTQDPPPDLRRKFVSIVAFLPPLSMAFTGLLLLVSSSDALVGGYVFRPFTLIERLLTESRVIFFYVENILVPNLGALGLFLDDIEVSRSLLDPPTTLFSLIALVVLTLLALRFRKKQPLVCLGWIFFLVGHLLESTVIPLEIAFEHRNYLPSIGILLSGIVVLANGMKQHGNRNRLIVFSTLLGSVFFAATWVRATTWENPQIHAFFEVHHHPESPRANAEFGRLLFEAAARKTGEEKRSLREMADDYLVRSIKSSRLGREGTYNLLVLRTGDRDAVTDTLQKRLQRELSTGFVNHVDAGGLNVLVDCLREGACDIEREALDKLLVSALSNDRMSGTWRIKLHLVRAKLWLGTEQRHLVEKELETAREQAIAHHSVAGILDIVEFQFNSGAPEAAMDTIQLARKLDRWHIYQGRISALEARISGRIRT